MLRRPPRLWLRFVTGLVVSLLLTSVSNETFAQAERAAAQALFDEAVELRKRNQIPAACAKFEESLRLDSAVGTRFNLADCYERLGRVASAWTYFLEVAAATSMAGQDERAEVARNRAKRLEPRLSRMVINPSTKPTGLNITRNGADVGPAQWGTKVPVDPGAYVIAAVAPGKRRWERRVEVKGPAGVVEVIVPPLADAPPGAPQPQPAPSGPNMFVPPPPDRGTPPSTIAGLTIAGLGVVGIGVGTAFGVIALDGKSDVDSLCPNERCPTVEAEALAASANEDAKTAGNISTGALIGGGVFVVTGLIVWLAVPDDEPAATTGLTWSPWLGPQGVGLGLARHF